MSESEGSGPRQIFGIGGVVAVVVGVVVGTGIFRLPTIVAEHSASGWDYVLFWIAGGFISILGALCYAELASNHPDAGGEYHFLSRAFGRLVGFVFAWGRMTVIQTGSIALIAFILGDYASELLDLGAHGSSIYAGVTIAGLTGLNMLGTAPSRTVQSIVTGLIVLILITLGILGIVLVAPESAGGSADGSSSPGAAMIFVLLTYGGWNEGVYLSAEQKDVETKMSWALVLGLLCVTALYVVVNVAYLRVLGLEGLRTSKTIGVDLTNRIFGSASSQLMAGFVVIAALSTLNASILTGARTNYALGRDFELFRILGYWSADRNTPLNALLVQGVIALFLVGLGSVTQEAVSTMVDYTAPVFWFFILLTTASMFVFRREEAVHAYEVPLYPVTPILFILVSGYMLYSSIVFTGFGAFVGIGILLVGLPVYGFT